MLFLEDVHEYSGPVAWSEASLCWRYGIHLESSDFGRSTRETDKRLGRKHSDSRLLCPSDAGCSGSPFVLRHFRKPVDKSKVRCRHAELSPVRGGKIRPAAGMFDTARPAELGHLCRRRSDEVISNTSSLGTGCLLVAFIWTQLADVVPSPLSLITSEAI